MKIEKSMLLRFGFIALLMNIPVFLNAQQLRILPSLSIDGFDSNSIASSVSGDGRTIVGWSTAMDGTGERDQAFQWTAEDGLLGLGYLPGNARSIATGVSGDGSAIVGWSRNSDNYAEAFRWTNEGMVGFGIPSDAVQSQFHGISQSGNVLFGSTSIPSAGTFHSRAMRWTETGGMENLGYLTGWDRASAILASSADGSILVGLSRNQSNQEQAIRWTASGEMQGLGFLSGGNRSSASAISGDGRIIVGTSDSRAFFWTESEGMQPLREDPQLSGLLSSASGVSFDGSEIVGRAKFGTNNFDEAFVWSSTDGMRSLNLVLDGLGVARNGWLLDWARGISADGQVIVGSASRSFGGSTVQRGFVLDFRAVPEPSSFGLTFSLLLPTFIRNRKKD